MDFELLRAREWRGSGLEPAPGADAVEQELRLAGVEPLEAVSRRASRLAAGAGADRPSPGTRSVSVLELLVLVLVLAALSAGAQLARLALGDPAEGPVNIAWFLLSALGLQTLLLMLTIVFWLLGGARLRLLFGALLALAARLAGARAAAARPRDASSAIERLSTLPALRPLALCVSHLGWAAFNLGLVGSAALTLSAEHHSFAWQSTLLPEPEQAARVLDVLLLPARIWPGGVSLEQVRLSRYLPDEGRFASDLAAPGEALALRQAWSRQLLASVIGFGLAPRLLLLGLALASFRLARRRLAPARDDPYVEAVLGRLFPPVETERRALAPLSGNEPFPERPGGDAAATATGGPPRSWLIARYLSALRESDDAASALFGAPVATCRELPRLDHRAAERQALAELRAPGGPALPAPVGCLLLVDYRLTPDAALGRLLDELRAAVGDPARLVLILSGGSAFRSTRLGASADRVRDRFELWRDFVSRRGIPAEQLIDFDAASATRASQRELARRLGVSTAEAPARPLPEELAGGASSAFEVALVRLEAALPGWIAELSDADPASAADAVALRLAAEARRIADSAFQSLDEAPTAVSTEPGSAALRSLLGHALRLPESLAPSALEIATRSLGRMGRLLGRIQGLDPRFVAAGLAAGFLAGPVGGLVAAGGAGLVAGASLASTLGALGGALGLAWSLRRAREAPPPEPSESPGEGDLDRLGFVLRIGALQSIVLAHQGRGEPAIARALERLASAERTASLPTPLASLDAARAYLRLVREHGE